MAEIVARERASGEEAPAGAAREILSRERFLTLYRATSAGLRRYLLRLTRSPDDAEDLLQESYIRLLTTEVPVMEPPALKSYLYRMATNLARDGYRREERQRRLMTAWTHRESGRQEATQTNHEQSSHLESLLGKMKPRERELLWLAYVEGFQHREIAEILGLKTESIRPLLFRARQGFGKMLRANSVSGGTGRGEP